MAEAFGGQVIILDVDKEHLPAAPEGKQAAGDQVGLAAPAGGGDHRDVLSRLPARTQIGEMLVPANSRRETIQAQARSLR